MSVIRLNPKNLRYREDSGKIYFTVEDLENFPEWPDSDLIELINGELFMVPSPTPSHQRLSQNIEFQIQSFLNENKIGELFHAPIDVELSKEDLVIPDIIIILNEKLNIIKEKRIEGTPSLIIEIVSTNKKRDLVDKKLIYEKYKIKEYIIIDPQEKIALIYRLKDNNLYDNPLKISLPGKLVVKTLNQLEISLE
ncbi:MAG: Uma2 family endonuclease [Candidatus Hodarchaeales archaeon]|jgi:Uma2 family endonuclease